MKTKTIISYAIGATKLIMVTTMVSLPNSATAATDKVIQAKSCVYNDTVSIYEAYSGTKRKGSLSGKAASQEDARRAYEVIKSRGYTIAPISKKNLKPGDLYSEMEINCKPIASHSRIVLYDCSIAADLGIAQLKESIFGKSVKVSSLAEIRESGSATSDGPNIVWYYVYNALEDGLPKCVEK